MNMYMCCMYDVVAKQFSSQFVPQINKEDAERSIKMALTSSVGAQAMKFRDIDFYHVGNFDTETGIFEAVKPSVIIKGASVITDEQIAKVHPFERSYENVKESNPS